MQHSGYTSGVLRGVDSRHDVLVYIDPAFTGQRRAQVEQAFNNWTNNSTANGSFVTFTFVNQPPAPAHAAGTRAVVRRYEMYQYTGAYDPVTHEALCADGLCNAPAEGEVGDFIGAQMAAANVGVPSVTVSINGGGKVASSDRVISCGSKCSASYEMNAQVTLTASADSGSVFTGWGGSCSGTLLTCSVTVSKDTQVQANFK
jgi:hypothetical protein